MSFLKITDPSKRDFIVNEFLKSKRNIQQSSISDKLGDISLQRELTNLYKPITDSQAGIAKELDATSTALKALPASISSSLKAIMPTQYPAIEATEEVEDPAESIQTLYFGSLATKYLDLLASNNKTIVDTTFGIYRKDGQFYIGTSPITIQDNDITVGQKTYTGTPGLWELVTLTHPDKYTSDDLVNYESIMNETNAMIRPDDPGRPKSSRSAKWRDIIKPVWDRRVKRTPGKGTRKGTTGKGVTPPVILPSDPNDLVEKLMLRMDAYNAGNTGARNEAVAICDELLRQGVLDKDSYKEFMKQLDF